MVQTLSLWIDDIVAKHFRPTTASETSDTRIGRFDKNTSDTVSAAIKLSAAKVAPTVVDSLDIIRDSDEAFLHSLRKALAEANEPVASAAVTAAVRRQTSSVARTRLSSSLNESPLAALRRESSVARETAVSMRNTMTSALSRSFQ